MDDTAITAALQAKAVDAQHAMGKSLAGDAARAADYHEGMRDAYVDALALATGLDFDTAMGAVLHAAE
jgi:hypothetical protein